MSSLLFKGIDNCERYIVLEIITVGLYFISKYYSKLSLNHIQRRACRHARSSCCSVSSDRQLRATIKVKWDSLLEIVQASYLPSLSVAIVCLSLSE